LRVADVAIESVVRAAGSGSLGVDGTQEGVAVALFLFHGSEERVRVLGCLSGLSRERRAVRRPLRHLLVEAPHDDPRHLVAPAYPVGVLAERGRDEPEQWV